MATHDWFPEIFDTLDARASPFTLLFSPPADPLHGVALPAPPLLSYSVSSHGGNLLVLGSLVTCVSSSIILFLILLSGTCALRVGVAPSS